MKTFKVSQLFIGIFGIAAAIGAVQNHAVASSVADDSGAAASLVTQQTTSATAGATAGLIAGNIQIGPPPISISAPSVPSAPTVPGGAPSGGGGGAPGAPGGDGSTSLFDRYGLAAIHNGTSGGVQSSKQDKFSMLRNKLGNMPQYNSRIEAGKSAQGKNPRHGVWMQGAYTVIDNDEVGGVFDGDVINLVAGIDTKVARTNDRMVLGVALSYESTDITTDFNNGTLEASGFTVVPYLGYSISPKLSVDVAVGYGWIDYDTSSNRGAVTTNFDSTRIFGASNLTGNFSAANGKFRITPKVGVLAFYEELDANIGSDGASNPETGIRLGVLSFGTEAGYRAGNGIEPFLGIKGTYDFVKNSPSVLANGKVASDDDFAVTYTAGLNIRRGQFTGALSASTTQHKNELQVHTISGRIRLDF